MNKLISSGLRKSELLRGYDSFDRIFRNSRQFKTKLLTGYLRTEKIELNKNDSPLTKSNFKVGFIISKKKLKKANKRIRIKRLLRETFRLNRENCLRFIPNPEKETKLIIGLNHDAEIINNMDKKLISYKDLNDDMMILLDKINSYLVTNS
jgi:ribonuclease P protein component